MSESTNTIQAEDEPINVALKEHQASAEDWRHRALLADLHTWAQRFSIVPPRRVQMFEVISSVVVGK